MTPIHVAVRNGITIELKLGDITHQDDIQAVVNAANRELMSGGGVAGAIHSSAGPELAEACKPLAPIRPGEAVITPAFDLPNDSVIHCLGPVYGQDTPSPDLLALCYKAALSVAETNEVKSVAFPAISTGAFGYPLDEAAEVALGAVLGVADDLVHVKLIRFVLRDDAARDIHGQVLSRLAEQGFATSLGEGQD
ncbi:macro domain-containing protein [Hydrocarboniclastica marina]|uniref:RNase III inhibitor n=1 Tax=Hydrocarboniclastica marina TaxID=2259620 RepID=A0A4P7XJE1_9ALTE|nr:macro domain-containing protein [Hydrocarboniclastica marina]MAL97581.1 RNase III inhibitor [Alteromonadaceae bacterium]QCF26674.1 RNase III inhibitor [Hydrocarboniclastica marina]